MIKGSHNKSLKNDAKNAAQISLALVAGIGTFRPPDWLESTAYEGPQCRVNGRSVLARAVSDDLEARGCKIPQTYISGEPHNVIKGQVLCTYFVK